MPRAFAVDETIDRSAAEVWNALTDWDRAPRWMAGVDTMHAAGPVEAGTALTFEARGKSRAAEITACAVGRSITLTSRQGPVTADYVYTVEPLDEKSCRASLVADCRVRGPMVFFGPLLRLAVRKTDGGQMKALKAAVEAA